MRSRTIWTGPRFCIIVPPELAATEGGFSAQPAILSKNDCDISLYYIHLRIWITLSFLIFQSLRDLFFLFMYKSGQVYGWPTHHVTSSLRGIWSPLYNPFICVQSFSALQLLNEDREDALPNSIYRHKVYFPLNM